MKTKFKNSFEELKNVKSITLAGMLLATIVVMGYFANFTLTILPMVKVTFSFLPQALGGMILGPFVSSIMCALGDIISYFSNPQGGMYFPGWTLNSLLAGLIFGIFLYKNNASLKNIICAKLTILVFVEIFLGSLWLNIQFNLPFFETMSARALANSLSAPIEIAIIYIVAKSLKSVFKFAK